LACGSDGNGTVRLRNAASEGELRCLDGHGGPPHAVCFSPDGKTLASVGFGGAVLWDTEGAERLRLDGDVTDIQTVCFSRDGQRLASGSQDGTVRLWGVATGAGQPYPKGQGSNVWAVCFSPDGRALAGGGRDRTVRLWDTEGAEQFCLKGHVGGVGAVCFSP